MQITLRRFRQTLRVEQATKILRQKNEWPLRSLAVGRSLAVALLLVLLASLGACPDSTRRETHDWKAAVAFADAAWQRGDLLEAQSAYLRAARIASWKDDWKGMLAAACGMKRIEDARAIYLNTRSVLVPAMIGAERNRSGTGLRAVAQAFTTIGERDAAAMVLSKVEPGWPQSDNDSFTDSGPWNCKAGGQRG
jgi:hypothetical protein